MMEVKEQVIYTFHKDSASEWQVVDDVVMGGRSNGEFSVSREGHGVFSGLVSLENNGGFSSVMHQLETPLKISDQSHIKLRVKGDGSTFQFRMKENSSDRHSYKHEFQTTGEWQEIELAYNDFIPSFRGRTLDLPAFTGEQLSEIRFLIGNKKAQEFKLEVDWISSY